MEAKRGEWERPAPPAPGSRRTASIPGWGYFWCWKCWHCCLIAHTRLSLSFCHLRDSNRQGHFLSRESPKPWLSTAAQSSWFPFSPPPIRPPRVSGARRIVRGISGDAGYEGCEGMRRSPETRQERRPPWPRASATDFNFRSICQLSNARVVNVNWPGRESRFAATGVDVMTCALRCYSN